MGYHEEGSTLIEALAALAVASIMGLGIAYAISKVSTTQATLNAQSVSAKGIRNMMQNGTCASATVSLTSAVSPPTAAVTCSTSTLNYTISSDLNGVVTTSAGSLNLPNYQATSTNSAMGSTLNIKSSQQ